MTVADTASDPVDPRPFGLALTVEELSSLPFLMGGECEVADRLGIARIADADDPIFDIGFRSLLVRGLLRIDGDDVELFEELRALGELLTHAEDAWTLAIETDAAIETLALIRAQERAICLLPGPIGVYSYRVVTADLPTEIAALVKLIPASELPPLRNNVAAAAVAQRALPAGSPVFIELDTDGQLSALTGDEHEAHDVPSLAQRLERS